MTDSDVYKYVVYKPSGGDALVNSGRQVIYYYSGDEALYAAINTYLVDTTWVSRMSWNNDTDATQTYTHSYTTGLTVTKGDDVSNGFSLGSKYKGSSVKVDHQERVFATAETTEATTVTIDLNVAPHSFLIFYQRRYRFRDSMFFILDAWGQDWNVGSWGGYDLSKKECEVEIMSDDYATLQAELDGTTTGTMSVDTVGAVQAADTTRKRENCTERCKSKLDDMGV